MKSTIQRLFLATIFAASAQSTFAQTNQLGGGNAGGGGGAGAAGGAPAGATTEGIGGVTSQEIGGEVAAGGPGDAAGAFIGGGLADLFAGGALTTQRNGNRTFQALTPAGVPTGTNRNTTGTPRTIRTTWRIGFAFPKPDAVTSLIGQSGPPIHQVASLRPEFRGVSVIVNSSGTAILSGAVPDAASKRLAANLVRLRPGIRKVDNQLAIAAEAQGLHPDIGKPVPVIPDGN